MRALLMLVGAHAAVTRSVVSSEGASFLLRAVSRDPEGAPDEIDVHPETCAPYYLLSWDKDHRKSDPIELGLRPTVQPSGIFVGLHRKTGLGADERASPDYAGDSEPVVDSQSETDWQNSESLSQNVDLSQNSDAASHSSDHNADADWAQSFDSSNAGSFDHVKNLDYVKYQMVPRWNISEEACVDLEQFQRTNQEDQLENPGWKRCPDGYYIASLTANDASGGWPEVSLKCCRDSSWAQIRRKCQDYTLTAADFGPKGEGQFQCKEGTAITGLNVAGLELKDLVGVECCGAPCSSETNKPVLGPRAGDF
jgi:hypothetical protein